MMTTLPMGGCTMVGFWIGAAIVVFRRPTMPRRIDLLYIRWGFVPLLVLGITIAARMHGGRG